MTVQTSRWYVVVREGERYAITDHGREIHIERINGGHGWHRGVTLWTGVRMGGGYPGYRTVTSHLPERTQGRVLALVWAGDPVHVADDEAKPARLAARVRAARSGERKWMIWDEDLRDAIALSERGSFPPYDFGGDPGARWLAEDLERSRHPWPNYSVHGAREEHAEEPGYGVIYGLGGFHRYAVRQDGEIFFYRSHAIGDAAVAAAEAAGFRVD